MSRKATNTIISVFGLDKRGLTQDNVDFFNVDLDEDNLGFFDYNRILKYSSTKTGKKIADNLSGFLLALFTTAIKKDTKLGLELLDGIKECNDTRLGYSNGKSYGVSIGKKMKPIFLNSLSFFKQAYVKNQMSFNTLKLGIDNISYDRISDICVSINLESLIDYTNDECKRYGIASTKKKTFKIFDLAGKIWKTKTYNLPEFNGSTIIFIPKIFISSKSRAICTLDQFVSYGFKTIIQYSGAISHLKNKHGKIYYKDYEDYLKKNGISKKQIARDLITKHNDIISKFEAIKNPKITDLSTLELETITNS